MPKGLQVACETPGCRGLRNVRQEMCHACWQQLRRADRDAIMAAQRGGRFRERAELGRSAREKLGARLP